MDELDQGNWLVGYKGDDRRRRETSEFVDPFDEYEMDWQRGVDTQIRFDNLTLWISIRLRKDVD